MSKNFLTNWRTLVSAMAIITACVVACGSNTSDNVSNIHEAKVATPAQEDAPPSESNTSIKGKITNASNELIILREMTVEKFIFLDSVRTDEKGKYQLSSNVKEATIVLVNIGSEQSFGVPLVIKPNGKISLDVDVSTQFPAYKIKGDQVNDQMKILFDQFMVNQRKGVEFNERISKMDPRSISDSMKKELNAEYLRLQKTKNDDIMDFVLNNPGSEASFFAAMFFPEPSIELQDAALEAMKKNLAESRYTQQLEKRLNAIKPLDVGGIAPEISLKSPDGSEIKLSSLKGQYVLIDFWASWCGPCRRENPNVVRMYKKYHDFGFEIYGVSLDKDGNKWKAAIKRDGLTWKHVSDLKGWSSSAAALYNIHAIPATILLDKNGRIIAKDLRGAELEAKLQEIFN